MKKTRDNRKNRPLINRGKYLYGKNTVLQALKKGRVEKVYFAKDFKDKDILNEMKNRLLTPQNLDESLFENFKDANHQGIIAEVEPYFYLSLEKLIADTKLEEYPLLVLVDQITDPHNLGAILRNIEALGGHGLIIKKDQTVEINATVAKVASGALDHVPVTQVVNLNATIEKLKQNGYWIIGAAGEAEKDYRDFDYKGPIGLVIGSEGKGISPLVKSNCDVLVKIPMVGQINSLNASAATAVFLAEIYKQRYPLKK